MTGRTQFMSKKRSGIAGFYKEDEERKKLQPLLKLSLAVTQYNQYIMQVLYNGNHFRLMIKILTPSLGAFVRSKHTYFLCDVLKYSIRLPVIILKSTERSKATFVFQNPVM